MSVYYETFDVIFVWNVEKMYAPLLSNVVKVKFVTYIGRRVRK